VEDVVSDVVDVGTADDEGHESGWALSRQLESRAWVTEAMV
jgi:hypothetical protein